MPNPRLSFASCIDPTNQNIYVIGGQDISRSASASCQMYSITNNTWTPLPLLATPLYSGSCVVT